MSEVLKFSGIQKTYGDKAVIPGFDLEVRAGAFVALLGPSGCGKTTLLRMVAGLEEPTGGELWIGSRRMWGGGQAVPPEDRGLGMVFQSYAVWPHLNVAENVAFPLKIRGMRGEEAASAVKKVLELVHLETYAERMPHQLSGGQQQRVALARALVRTPKVLLLDEPLANLDARLRAEMRREIRDLHRKLGMTCLYVTHDQREAFEMSTEVIVLENGAIAQRGTPEEIRRTPKPGFVAEFLAEF